MAFRSEAILWFFNLAGFGVVAGDQHSLAWWRSGLSAWLWCDVLACA
jgi:hypothetical protein